MSRHLKVSLRGFIASLATLLVVVAAVGLGSGLGGDASPLPQPVRKQVLYVEPGDGWGARPEATWLRANFHSHARPGAKGVGDDGRVPPRVMHEVYARLGYDLSVHTPHSNRNRRTRSAERWMALKEYEELSLNRDLSMPRSLGLELSVAHGPNLRRFRIRRYGRGVGRTLNHTIVFGADEFIPHLLPLKLAAEMSHVFGGLLFVAHPVIWEKEYFNQPDLIDKLDGIEVYNGIVLHKTGETDEATYRDAVAYSGGGTKVAAIGGTDSHGLQWAKEVVTFVRAANHEVSGVVEAIRERRTIVTRGFFDLDVDYPQLGRVVRSAEVSLDLGFNRPLEQVELWRETELAASWRDVERVRWRERIRENSSYVFRFVHGEQFGMTSATWFEPRSEQLPDLTVPQDQIKVEGNRVQAVIRNVGEAMATGVRVEVSSELPHKRKRRPQLVVVDRLGAGEESLIKVTMKRAPALVYVKVDPESYQRAVDNDQIVESNERNNAAVLAVKGSLTKRLRRAGAIRTAQKMATARSERWGGLRRDLGASAASLSSGAGVEIPELEDHEE